MARSSKAPPTRLPFTIPRRPPIPTPIISHTPTPMGSTPSIIPIFKFLSSSISLSWPTRFPTSTITIIRTIIGLISSIRSSGISLTKCLTAGEDGVGAEGAGGITGSTRTPIVGRRVRTGDNGKGKRRTARPLRRVQMT